jgi:thiol-disulfide isomerase/thioredoxin
MIGTKELLEACDRIEVIGAGSEAATAATYNRTQILADALIRAGTDPAKRSETLARLIDSALKLGRAKPPHPATCEILNRLALEALAQGDRAHARELYALMGTEFPDHPIGKYGKGAAERIEAVGGELSDFRGKDLIDGRDRDLKEFRGKVVLIDFWATWCQPCREEMPKLAKLRRELQPKGFELVGFCLGQTAEEARQFVSEYGFDWPHFLDPGASGELTDSPVAIRFGVLSIPFKMVIDREGRLLAAGNTFDEIKPALDKAVESPKVSNDAPNPATPEKSEKPK